MISLFLLELIVGAVDTLVTVFISYNIFTYAALTNTSGFKVFFFVFAVAAFVNILLRVFSKQIIATYKRDMLGISRRG